MGLSGRVKFWQKRFWDHVIRDEKDFEAHIHYIHYNPVKHGLVLKPELWAHSSYQHWQKMGYYPAEWGWSEPEALRQQTISFGE